MAKPNYAFAKRQRDIQKKQKKEAKRLKKAESTETPPADADAKPPTTDVNTP